MTRLGRWLADLASCAVVVLLLALGILLALWLGSVAVLWLAGARVWSLRN